MSRATDPSAPDFKSLKIGGILCQSCFLANAFNVVLGCGLNVSNAAPTTCVNDVLRNAAIERGVDPTALGVSRHELLATFLQHFDDFLVELEQNGFDALEGTYRRYWLHERQRLTLADTPDSTATTTITIVGLTTSGFLKGVDDAGTTFELHPDGNSLDMMSGLLKRKAAA